MMNSYSRLIPRLNGKEIEERFDYYLGLVKKGVAGFIVFGGELETVRAKVRELQDAADRILIIASDLEQGLGQQIQGGTIFPPAMAIASAVKSLDENQTASILQELYTAFAVEARYVGINTIFAPVLDINTNPDNPIIATRAFGEGPDTVSFFGCEMVKILQHNNIMACGKHFPGHGDTEIDSHISLPIIRKDLSSLEGHEFVPFRNAIHARVRMIMLGHLAIPSLDPSGKPASLSGKVISYLRETMGFQGLTVTDAMNMGAIGGYHEHEASLTALNAGVDIILHPTDPDDVASYLQQKQYKTEPLSLHIKPLNTVPFDFRQHQLLSSRITDMAITVSGESIPRLQKPFLIVLTDEKGERGNYLINALRERFPDMQHVFFSPQDTLSLDTIPDGADPAVAVFSQVKAWKATNTKMLRTTLGYLKGKAKIFISFGNPYVLKDLDQGTMIYAYWDSESAQKAVAGRLHR
jgi:beta-N-acetylhexosaminidase